MNLSAQLIIAIGATFAMLSVILGAFGAHALKTRFDEYSLSIFHTGTEYQMYHAFALIAVGICTHIFSLQLTVTAYIFIGGIVLFSGSLYALAFTGIKTLGAITPIGGLLFIIGWLMFAYKLVY